MSLFPESRLGIWLNTPTKFLEQTSAGNLRPAKNDACWSTAANDSTPLLILPAEECDSRCQPPARLAAAPRPTGKLEHRQPGSDHFVRLGLVSNVLRKYCKELQSSECQLRPTVVDLGGDSARTQARLEAAIDDLEYINAKAVSGSTVCASLTQPCFADSIRARRPDVLLCLEVLSELAQEAHSLRGALQQLASVSSHASLIVFSLPASSASLLERERIDNPLADGQSPVAVDQWVALLEEFFELEPVRAFDFIAGTSARRRASTHASRESDDAVPQETGRAQAARLTFLESIDIKISEMIGTWPIGRALGSSTLLLATPR